MASNQEHYRQAVDNYGLLRRLAQDEDTRFLHDWQVTITFYVAVHLVNFLLANEGLHPQDHKATQNGLTLLRNIREKTRSDIQTAHEALYTYSRKARYLKGSDIKRASYITGKDFILSLYYLDLLIESKAVNNQPFFPLHDFGRINFQTQRPPQDAWGQIQGFADGLRTEGLILFLCKLNQSENQD